LKQGKKCELPPMNKDHRHHLLPGGHHPHQLKYLVRLAN